MPEVADSTTKALPAITTLAFKQMAPNRIMQQQAILEIKQQKIVF
jgi:hypothetical protein